jgi:hypothetical protein
MTSCHRTAIPQQFMTLTQAISTFDVAFQHKWYQQVFSPRDPLWTTPPPPSHFVALKKVPSAFPPVVQPTRDSPRPAPSPHERVPSKRKKLTGGRARPQPDFICATHIFTPSEAFPASRPAISTLLNCMPNTVRFPLSTDSEGTSKAVCFHSCFPPSHNTRATGVCTDRKMPPLSRLHIDLSLPFWKNRLELYWDPMVVFLKDEVVCRYLSYSPALKLLTSAQTW